MILLRFLFYSCDWPCFNLFSAQNNAIVILKRKKKTRAKTTSLVPTGCRPTAHAIRATLLNI